jgi:hypothetical protein
VASEEDVLLREVDEELSHDQFMATMRRYRVPLAIGAVAIIAVVAGIQIFESQREARAAEAAREYAELSFAAESEPAPTLLSGFAAKNDTGYADLAALRAASARAASGDYESAAELFASVYESEHASPALRDLARMRAAYAIFDWRPERAASLVSGVETEAFRPFASEISAAAALEAGSYMAARAGFQALADNEAAPQSLRTRARALAAVADAGEAGAPIFPARGDAEAVNFIEQFGAELEAAGVPLGGDDVPEPAPENASEAMSDPGAGEEGGR